MADHKSDPVTDRAAGDESGNEYDDLLAGIGAERSEPDPTALIECKDVTIGELTRLLAGLRPLGDLAARAEQDRIVAVARADELEARIEELERRLTDRDGVVESRSEEAARLQQQLTQREEVLDRERARHDATRQKLTERKAVAAERWRELRALRAKLKRIDDGSTES
jgi:vacuolar-type H+-ATPase subunit I/STV1